MKTARFRELVKAAGRPEVHVSWVKPADDPVLRKAAKENRVLTVHREDVGTRKDFGSLGVEPSGGRAQFLIFPKSLAALAGRRVVGIDYDLLRNPPPAAKPEPKSAHAAQKEAVRPARSELSPGRAARPELVPVAPKPPPQWRPEVTKALRDLKAGRTVAAYERLQSLLAAAKESD